MRTLPLFYQEISRILPAARQKRYSTVHSEMTTIYCKIGERIVEKELQGENRSEYGTFVNKYFSKDLSKQFGKGFSICNVKNFRQFYHVFRDKPTASPPYKELSWTHYRILMRVADPDARQYYIREAADKNWSTRQLARNIKAVFNKSGLSTREVNRKKRFEERKAARAALNQIYCEITAMATKMSTPNPGADSNSATTLHSATILHPATTLHPASMLHSAPGRSNGSPPDRTDGSPPGLVLSSNSLD
jgi:hypothetical protein